MAIWLARNNRQMGIPLALMVIGCLFLVAGCGTIKTVKKATTSLIGEWGGDDTRVKKRIALIPFENWTPWQAGHLNGIFTSLLTETIRKECPGILLVIPGEPDYPESIRALSATDSGKLDNIALARICRQSGINGVITGQLSHISADKEKRGMIFRKKMHHFARLQLEVSMLHAGTAAKLMDNTYYADVGVAEADFELLQQRQAIQLTAVEEPMAQAATAVTEAICERLEQVPWEGYVLSVNGNSAVISFGESIGLRIDDLLTLHEAGKLTESKSGYRYILPGRKLGDVTVMDVSENDARITVTEGSAPITVGCIVRLNSE